MAKSQPRQEAELIKFADTHTKKETLDEAIRLGYGEGSAMTMVSRIWRETSYRKLKRIFRGRMPTFETWQLRATPLQLRPSSERKLYDRYQREQQNKAAA